MPVRKSSTPVIVAAMAAAMGVTLLVAAAHSRGGPSVHGSGSSGPAEFQTPPDGSGGPFVMSVRETAPGFSLLGIRLHDARFEAQVGVVPPPGCILAIDRRIDPEGPCRTIAIGGTVTGEGTLASGESFVIVAIPISGDCYEAIEPGDPWPPPRAACGG